MLKPDVNKLLRLGMFPVNRLTEKNSVNRFSINRTETEKMAANLVFCKSRFICVDLMTLI